MWLRLRLDQVVARSYAVAGAVPPSQKQAGDESQKHLPVEAGVHAEAENREVIILVGDECEDAVEPWVLG